MMKLVTYIRATAGLFFALSIALPIQASVRDDAPPRGDPFSGLFDKAKMTQSSAALPRSLLDKRLAVILSESTERHLKWSAELVGGLTGMDRAMKSIFGGGQKDLDESDRLFKQAFEPEKIVHSVVGPIVNKSSEVQIIANLAEFRDGNFDYLVLVDITFHHVLFDSWVFIGNRYEAGAFISAYFIDKAGNLVGKIEAGESKPVSRSRFLNDEDDIRKRVAAQFVSELARQFGPDRPVAVAIKEAPAAPTSTPVVPRSAAERLKDVDALLKQGLISPEEADIKRKKILEDV